MKKSVLLIVLLATFHFIFIELFFDEAFTDTKNTSWVWFESPDLAQHQFYQNLFKNSSLSFKQFKYQNVDEGNITLGLSGVTPILALVSKITDIKSDIQFYHYWLLFCTLFLSYFSFKILKFYKLNLISSLAGALLIGLNPFMFYRYPAHDGLLAHFFILQAIYYTIANVKLRWWCLGLIFSLLVHAYIHAMFLLFFLNYVRQYPCYFKNLKNYILIFSFLFLYAYCLYWFGYILTDMTLVPEARFYPTSLSSIWTNKALLTSESYIYVGTGGLVLILIGATLILKNRTHLKLPNSIIFIALCLFVFSNFDSFNFNHQNPQSDQLKHFIYIFRSNARFSWPFLYAILIISVISIFENLNRKTNSTVILTVLLAFQIEDYIKKIDRKNVTLATLTPSKTVIIHFTTM